MTNKQKGQHWEQPTVESLKGVALGSRQRDMLDDLLSDDGLLLSDYDSSEPRTREWGSAGYKTWEGMCPRLVDALKNSVYRFTDEVGYYDRSTPLFIQEDTTLTKNSVFIQMSEAEQRSALKLLATGLDIVETMAVMDVPFDAEEVLGVEQAESLENFRRYKKFGLAYGIERGI